MIKPFGIKSREYKIGACDNIGSKVSNEILNCRSSCLSKNYILTQTILIVFSDKIVDVLIVVNIGNVDVYKVEDGSLLIIKKPPKN